MRQSNRYRGSVATLVLLFITYPALLMAQAQGSPSSISARESCDGKPRGAACWMELKNQPGCYYWISALEMNATATWSAGCSSGLAKGTGEITLVWGSDREHSYTFKVKLQQGKQPGQQIIRTADDIVVEGPHAAGKEQDGHWVTRFADGIIIEGPIVNGKRHGYWANRSVDGDVHIGPYIDNRKHGHWVVRSADGQVQEGPFVDDKKHGHWVIRTANGQVQEVPFVDDKKHGHWVVRSADGQGARGPFRGR